MANEIFKELKTRIALKYNTYEYWVEGAGKDYAPLKGEVCFCSIPSGNNEATTAPTVLFKVGVDGQTKFSALKWASALAADVYDWAKVAGANVFTKDGVGNVVSGIEYDATLNGGKGGFKFTTASVATAEGLEDLQEAVAAIEKDIADNRSAWAKDDNDNTTYQFSIPTEGDDKGKLLVEKKEIGESTWTRVNAYDFVTPDELSKTLEGYYTKGEVDGLIQGVKDIVNGLDESVTTVTEGTGISVTDAGTGNDHAYTVELDVDGAKAALGLSSAAYVTVDSLNATAKGYADGKDDAIAEAKKAGTDAANALDAYSKLHEGDYTNTKIDELVQGAKDYADSNDANTEYHVEYDATNKKIKLVAGADASKMEIDATAFIKDGMIESVELVTEDDGGNKGQFLKITWNTDGDIEADDVTYVNVTTLVDIYVGENGDYVNVTVTSDNKIKADLTDAAKTKLNKVWEEVGVAAGLDAALKVELQKEIDDDIVAYNTSKNFGDIITHNVAEFASSAENGAKELAQGVKDVVDANKSTWDKAGTALQASDLTAYDTSKNFGDIITHNDAEYQKANDTLKHIADNFTVNEYGYFNEFITVGNDRDDTATSLTKAGINIASDSMRGGTSYGMHSITYDDGNSNTHHTYNLPTESGTIATQEWVGSQGYATEDWVEGKNYLTEITTTANNGLKVTNKNHIDIDTDVVFVLDCNW